MWQSFGLGDEGDCIIFNKCLDAGKNGKIGCELAGCDYRVSDGFCENLDFDQVDLSQGFPSDEDSCKAAKGKWTIFASCEEKGLMGDGTGDGIGDDTGGSVGDDLTNDGGNYEEFDPKTLTGTSKWQDACYYMLTDTTCEDVEHEGKDAEEGDNGCTWKQGRPYVSCQPEDQESEDWEAAAKCFEVTNDPTANVASMESSCIALTGCAWEVTPAQGSCNGFDLCEKYNEKADACALNGCSFVERDEFMEADSQQCFGSFGGDAADDFINGETNNECAKIENVANCNTKTNEITGAALCMYKFSSLGECLVKGAETNEFCQCYSEDCSQNEENWYQDAASCNSITSDDGGNACEFDDSAKFGQCTQIQCYDMSTSTKCGDMDGCKWVESDYDDYCATEDDAAMSDDSLMFGDDSFVNCFDFSSPNKIDQCTAENGCAVVAHKVKVCDGKDGAEDDVKEACQQFAFSQNECEAQNCEFAVKEQKTCDRALSCARGDEKVGGSKEVCEAITDEDDNTVCFWEAVEGMDISGFCQEKIEGQADGEQLVVNGTCGLDQTRRGDEVAASYGTYSSYYSSYASTNDYASTGDDFSSYDDYQDGIEVDDYGCYSVNTTDVTDRATCERLHDDEGYKMCELSNSTAQPMRCEHPARGWQGSGMPPQAIQDVMDIDCSQDNGNGWSETDCTVIDGCHFESKACKCANPEALPSTTQEGYESQYGGGGYASTGSYGGSYGEPAGYGGYYGGSDDGTPQTEFQCDATPAEAECVWEDAGTCQCDDAPDDETVNTYHYSKTECADNRDLYTCQWYGFEMCVANIDRCDFARSEEECTTGAMKATGCEFTDAVVEFECKNAEVSETDRCARYSDSNTCDQVEGCRMQESKPPPPCNSNGPVDDNEGDGPTDDLGGSDNGFFEMADEECFRD
eukprot:gene23945-16238_t